MTASQDIFVAFTVKPIPATTILALGLLLVIASTGLRLLYLACYHPLARYPGPILSRFTDLRAAYHGLRGDIHLDMHQCHLRYGDYVRYGPNKLLINDPTVMNEIYGYRKNVQKSQSYMPLVPGGKGWSVLTCIDKDLHRTKRRLLAMGFSDASLKTFEPRMLEHMRVLRSKLDSGSATDAHGWSTPKEMSDLCRWMTFDVTADLAFGESPQLQNSQENRFLVDCINVYSWRMGCYYELPALMYLDFLLLAYLWTQGKLRPLAKFLKWKRTFGSKIMLKEGGTKRGIFSLVLNAEGANRFTENEVWAEGIFLMLAGSDTSSTAICALLFYLSRYPAIYERLAQEIRQRFAKVDDICIANTSSCHYLQACITETLRMAPPTSAAPWREILLGGLQLGNHYIPAKCDVGASIYATHHNKDYFQDPFTFDPERWIASDQKQLDRLYMAYNPFSLGPRGCAGRSIAFAEIAIFVAQVLLEFDFRAPPGTAGLVGCGGPEKRAGRRNPMEFQLESHVTALTEGPELQFRRRS
ncbi:related to cytochrome P450 CYP3/CYP5/CYP6/CYP9 subfamilies [Ramularia collo-cygni]|uniref:Related to cytochrome P450 CYP3/CYP5/CYP6/CYP9 subfamilies n=1 Tax=Ramularia collo-cygni TaxID=112498 RepID=A0A2D3VNI7_9PEZI|nr:related to cytochrome P450 CYP3/CYP5/CYP6/CYP9 subfamilies [Ramularia collo-cygni]CZT25549.1 related to cytochrome P450 CYP3/CYP5/CYP6/CYP9 subfamilies [Ramularia collo-cygni]